MIVYIGADHGGFNMKAELIPLLEKQGYAVEDMGAHALDPADDFPDFSAAVAEKVSASPEDARGIVICRNGIGVLIVANKFKNVRAALGLSPAHVTSARSDDDVNVLSIAADYTSPDDAGAMAEAFLKTPFDAQERRLRRLQRVADIESKMFR